MVKNIQVEVTQSPYVDYVFYIEITNMKKSSNNRYNGAIGYRFTVTTNTSYYVHNLKKFLLNNIKKASQDKIIPRMQTKSVAQNIYVKIIQYNGV